ncbi:hypothetical protein LZC95_16465 [Pendulispora brunnea]|uniref:Uncharacterized protein n=1 Tax=Pendulispora brunnea TaxID=2905690 RepID=A0ABZ2KID3_9BACT
MRASFRQIFVCLEDDASSGRAAVMQRTFWNPRRASSLSHPVGLASVVRLDRRPLDNGATPPLQQHRPR